MNAGSRWVVARSETIEDAAAALAKRVRIQPRPVPLPDGLLSSFQTGAHDTGTAVLWYEPGGTSAVLVTSGCEGCRPDVKVTRRDAKGGWKSDDIFPPFDVRHVVDDNAAMKDALAKRGFEIRPVQRRQVYIDGKPVGEPFE